LSYEGQAPGQRGRRSGKPLWPGMMIEQGGSEAHRFPARARRSCATELPLCACKVRFRRQKVALPLCGPARLYQYGLELAAV